MGGGQNNGRVVGSAAEPRIAVVSGGSRGLGLEIVRKLADRGMHVVLTSRRVADGQAAIGLLGDAADCVAVRDLDITDAASVAQFAGWLRGRLGRCDVLVKTAVNAMTRMLADELAVDGVLVNACCPGLTRIEVPATRDGTRLFATADTAVWLATLPDDGPTGGFYRDHVLIEW